MVDMLKLSHDKFVGMMRDYEFNVILKKEAQKLSSFTLSLNKTLKESGLLFPSLCVISYHHKKSRLSLEFEDVFLYTPILFIS